MDTNTRTLSNFVTMIRFAAATVKLERIKIWLKAYFEESPIWNFNQEDPEILRHRTEMMDSLDKLIETDGADKSKAIRVFTQAAHFEIAATADNLERTEIESFVSLLEWTMANNWVIYQVDPKAHLTDQEIPRWLLTHKQQVQELKDKKQFTV